MRACYHGEDGEEPDDQPDLALGDLEHARVERQNRKQEIEQEVEGEGLDHQSRNCGDAIRVPPPELNWPASSRRAATRRGRP